MQILSARWMFDGKNVHENVAVAFEKKIEKIAPFEILETKYPDASITRFADDEVLMPGLVNPHLHLEFGAHTTQLHYGDFMAWLQSIIAHREELVERCQAACYKRQIEQMLSYGITAFGAISSWGKDLIACKAAPQRVVFFNEVIGSQPAAIDALYHDFMQRMEASKKAENDRFIPAVAIHSPYSVHPVLMRKVFQESGGMRLSAHFLESPAEKAWLENSDGPFKSFFENFLHQSHALQTPEAFLEHLDRPALLTHAVQAQNPLLEKIAQAGHTIVHCPRSNRLLGCGRLAIERLDRLKIPWMLGTDGKSSNTLLSLWDEMRAALMMHYDAPLERLATQLLSNTTAVGAQALQLPVGRIQENYEADLISCKLPSAELSAKQLPLQLILHTRTVHRLYIQGKRHA